MMFLPNTRHGLVLYRSCSSGDTFKHIIAIQFASRIGFRTFTRIFGILGWSVFRDCCLEVLFEGVWWILSFLWGFFSLICLRYEERANNELLIAFPSYTCSGVPFTSSEPARSTKAIDPPSFPLATQYLKYNMRCDLLDDEFFDVFEVFLCFSAPSMNFIISSFDLMSYP